MRKPFWNKTKKRWFVRVDGKQINLGEDKKEALKIYHELMAGNAPAKSEAFASEVIGKFLEWAKLKLKPRSHDLYQYYLEKFLAHIKGIRIRDLKHHHVHKWVDDAGWTGNTANNAIRCAVRPFAWAKKLGTISENPLTDVDRPSATPRECDLTDDQLKRIITIADPSFLDLLTILMETGCRPQEVRTMEARHLDRTDRAIVFPREESKGRKRRTIILTDTAYGVLSRLALKYPDGPLLRNKDGQPWKTASINNRFFRLSKKLGFSVSAYHIRHKYCTDALERGIDPVTVATLMGHSNVNMVWSVYQHIQKRSSHMHEAALRAVSRVG